MTSTNHLTQIIDNFKNKKIIVIGDVMLDHYVEGMVERISPEAPVQVVNVSREYEELGGAANVAHNIASLGGIPFLFGKIGRDSSGIKFLKRLKERDISQQFILASEGHQTITKTRVVSGSQQLLRIDHEDKKIISPEEEEKVLAHIKSIMADVHAVVISDYNKGFVTPMLAQKVIEWGSLNSVKVIIDPKPNNIANYRNAYLIKPNQTEAGKIVGKKLDTRHDVENAARVLSKELDSHILITRGSHGMTFCSKEGEISSIPTRAIEVFDVTGAGDTVTAALSLAIAGNSNIADAVIIANYAASLVVARQGTCAAHSEEVKALLSRNSLKILAPADIPLLVQRLRKDNKKIVWTNGCFDILHPGHVHLLREAKSYGDVLIVGLNSDASIQMLNGTERPILKENERIEILSALADVDHIIIFDEDTPTHLIEQILPDILVKGEDYLDKEVVGRYIVEKNGGHVVLINFKSSISTSEIITRVKMSNTMETNK